MDFIFLSKIRLFWLVFNNECSNPWAKALGFVLAVVATAVVACAVVFGVFEDDVLMVNALRIVAKMRGVVTLVFDSHDLEEGLSNCHRSLWNLNGEFRLQEAGEVDDDAIVILGVNAEVGAFAGFVK